MDLRKEFCDDPENYVNAPGVEIKWAATATQRAQIHTNLVLTSNTKDMKLCREQDQIIARFRKEFPDMEVREVRMFNTHFI